MPHARAVHDATERSHLITVSPATETMALPSAVNPRLDTAAVFSGVPTGSRVDASQACRYPSAPLENRMPPSREYPSAVISPPPVVTGWVRGRPVVASTTTS